MRKRCFKNFDGDEFRLRLERSNLEEIKECQNVDYAAELLVKKLAAILDHMAPIRKIQTRKNYAPWLSTDTKNIQLKRNDAQKKASQSGDPEDWRQFRSLRNLATSKSRTDKKNWERKTLDHESNSSTQLWRIVRGWLPWNGCGPPSQLFNDRKFITNSAGLAETMNHFFMDKIAFIHEQILL